MTVVPFPPANDEDDDDFVQTITITVSGEDMHVSTKGFASHFEEIGVLMTAVQMVVKGDG